jgi:uncharacterized membrane protein
MQGGLPYSRSIAINNAGVVVGQLIHCNQSRPFIYREGVLSELSGLPDGEGMAVGINDHGDVLGYIDDRPFIWRDGEVTLLAGVGSPRAINNHRQVLAADAAGSVLWDEGIVAHLPTRAEGANLNDQGQVVGTFDYASAFVWQPDGMGSGHLTVLPELIAGAPHAASAINEIGQIVGVAGPRAVLWDNGIAIDITPPSLGYPLMNAYGFDINEDSVILGLTQEDGPHPNGVPFIYEQGSFTFLPTPAHVDGTVAGAALNDHRVVAGGSVHWFGTPDQAMVWSQECFDVCCVSAQSP